METISKRISGLPLAEIKKTQYTVILTNYNGEEYIYNALDSIFIQDYPNIQLIITDDSSTNFDQSSLEKYINKHKKTNIKDVRIIVNEKNLGTVKTLNNALKKATGEFLLFFASDDQLVNERVLSNFSVAFKDRRKNIITSQWIICDRNLKPIKKYLSSMEAGYFNIARVKHQFFRLCKSNIYGAGATSYRTTLFQKYGIFDEKYRLLEDWPFWLRISWNKEKIFYENFEGLYHRGGGISESQKLSNTKKIFYEEILITYRQEILPRLDSFSNFQKISILKSYNNQIESLNNQLDLKKDYALLKENIDSYHLKLLWRLDKLNPHIFQKIMVLRNWNKQVFLTIVLSILFSFLYVNMNWTNENNIILSMCLLSYLIIYIGLGWLIKIKKIYELKQERSR